jgi:hypothetical protein
MSNPHPPIDLITFLLNLSDGDLETAVLSRGTDCQIPGYQPVLCSRDEYYVSALIHACYGQKQRGQELGDRLGKAAAAILHRFSESQPEDGHQLLTLHEMCFLSATTYAVDAVEPLTNLAEQDWHRSLNVSGKDVRTWLNMAIFQILCRHPELANERHRLLAEADLHRLIPKDPLKLGYKISALINLVDHWPERRADYVGWLREQGLVINEVDLDRFLERRARARAEFKKRLATSPIS